MNRTKPHIVTMRRVIDAESPEHAAQRFLTQIVESDGAHVELHVTPQAEPGMRVIASLNKKTIKTSREQDLMLALCALTVDDVPHGMTDYDGYCTDTVAQI